MKKNKIGRNSPCPCGSGLKHKKCCLGLPSSSQTLEANLRQIPYEPAIDAVDLALSICSESDSDPPVYSEFTAWLCDRIQVEREMSPQASSYGEEWSVASYTAAVSSRFESFRVQGEKLDLKTFRKMKLLISAAGDGRGQVALVDSLSERPPADYSNLRNLSPYELRHAFFTQGINLGKSQMAFKIMGLLRDEDHAPGEIDFLEALTCLTSGDNPNAIAFANRVLPSSLDYGRAMYIKAEAQALQADQVGLSKTLRAVSFTAGQKMLMYLRLLNERETDKEVAPELLEAVSGLSSTKMDTADPALNDLVDFLANICLELLRALRHAQQHFLLESGMMPTAEQTLDHLLTTSTRAGTLFEIVIATSIAEECISAHENEGQAQFLVDLIGSSTPTRQRVSMLMKCLFEFQRYEEFLSLFEAHDRTKAIREWPGWMPMVTLAYQAQSALSRPELELTLARIRKSVGTKEAGLIEQTPRNIDVQKLTPMGREAYLSATSSILAYERDDMLWQDAGMISLGFFRILEVEINAALMGPMHEAVTVEEISSLFLVLPQSKSKKWDQIVKNFRKQSDSHSPGYTLEQIFFLLARIRKSPAGDDSAIHEILRRPILDRLTPEGIVALESKQLMGLIDHEPREKYRNPPAHCRFITLTVARDCRDFVDTALSSLFRWLAFYHD